MATSKSPLKRSSKSKDEVIYIPELPKQSATPPLITLSQDTDKSTSAIPPLISLKVTNPVTYLKLWWKRVMADEGVDFKLRVRPLTAIAMVSVVALGSAGVGRLTALYSYSSQIPVVRDILPTLTPPTPTPDPVRETAVAGILKKSGGGYYLVTQTDSTLRVIVESEVDLSAYTDRRIFATGRLHSVHGTFTLTPGSTIEAILNYRVIATPQPTATSVPTASPTSIPAITPDL